MLRSKSRSSLRKSRHESLRKGLMGTLRKPRLAVFRSARHIYAQVIDDEAGVTLAAASSVDPELREKLEGPKTRQAVAVGELLAKRAFSVNVKAVVFDRGGHRFHGRVAALAEAARKQGLEF